MENQKDAMGMLDLITAPGFCVKDNQITVVNPPAAALQVAGTQKIPAGFDLRGTFYFMNLSMASQRSSMASMSPAATASTMQWRM